MYAWTHTANLRTKILDFRGFDSSRILILRDGILRSLGIFPETLSQQILQPSGIKKVGFRSGVLILWSWAIVDNRTFYIPIGHWMHAHRTWLPRRHGSRQSKTQPLAGLYARGRARQCMMKCSGLCETPWIRLRNERRNVTSNARCKIRSFFSRGL